MHAGKPTGEKKHWLGWLLLHPFCLTQRRTREDVHYHAQLRQLEKIKVSVTQHRRQIHRHPDMEIKDGNMQVAGSIGTH